MHAYSLQYFVYEMYSLGTKGQL